MKYAILLFLLPAITILSNCRSDGNSIRAARDEVCHNLAIPDEARVMPGEPLRPSNYNALAGHAGHLATCLRAERCVRAITEWERDCAEQREHYLEGSYLPGAFLMRGSCSVPRPDCLHLEE